MADVFDQASEREQMDRDLAIKEALRNTKLSMLTPNGRCYNCMEPIAHPKLFCDADCSADHEVRMRARRRN